MRQKIISELYCSKEINAAISKMQPTELQEDLKQELFIVICEMDEEKLIQLYTTGVIKFFIVRIILNMIKSNTSGFYKKFRQHFIEFTDNNQQIKEYDEELFNKLNSSFEMLHWYEKEIFRLYADNGQNVLQLSKDTKIPYRSLIKTINKVKTFLKYKIKNNGSI